MNIEKILQPEIQRFIDENMSVDLVQLILSGSPFEDISIQEIVCQIKGKLVAKKKFPKFLKKNIIFPPNINLQQTSSESTAVFKSNIFSGESLLDLTCGFGIDSFYMSEKFKHITLVENNNDLLEITKHNFKIFNKTNVEYFNFDANKFLMNNNQQFSLIYIDPSRRDSQNRKKIFLKDLSPNILEIQDELFKHTDRVVIKLSPLIDLSVIISQLKNISEIFVVALKNEVKEVLCVLNGDMQNLNTNIKLKIYNLESFEPYLEVYINEINKYKPSFGEPLDFLYIPNNAVIKSNIFGYISQRYDLQKLHPNTHLFTSDESIENFPGRKIKIKQINAKDIKKDSKFNVISKNYPIRAEEIKKKYNIKDGGNKYLIFTQSIKGKVILESI